MQRSLLFPTGLLIGIQTKDPMIQNAKRAEDMKPLCKAQRLCDVVITAAGAARRSCKPWPWELAVVGRGSIEKLAHSFCLMK